MSLDCMHAIRLNYKDLYRFAFRMLGSSETAEDMVQEAFLRFSRKPPDVPEGEAVRKWLFVVVRNLCISWLRKKPKGVDVSIDDSFDLNSPDQNPSESLLDDERSRMIMEAVLSLPPLMREIVILREYEELSYLDIAEMTGNPVGTVKSRLAKARELLRKRLQPYIAEVK